MKNDTDFLIELIEQSRKVANEGFDLIIEQFKRARGLNTNTTLKSRSLIFSIKKEIFNIRTVTRMTFDYVDSVFGVFYRFYSTTKEKGDKIIAEIKDAENKMWERINKTNRIK